jgi:erythromycin esterase
LNGSNAKIIIWGHNTHLGDAHYTDMPTRGRTNLGELLRKEWGEKKVFITGFGSYKGEYLGSKVWDTTGVIQKLLPAKKGTWEAVLHDQSPTNQLILLKDMTDHRLLRTWIEQRAVGVIGDPTYIPSIIPRRYDAFLYFDSSSSLHPFEHSLK